MPFEEIVCTKSSKRSSIPFQIAFELRPELEDIVWEPTSSVELARQLWKFQSEDRNPSYGIALAATLRLMMKVRNVEPQKIKEVTRITSNWVRRRNKFDSARKLTQKETPEQIKSRRKRINEQYGKKIKAQRTKDEAHPLLYYLRDVDVNLLTPSELHEEALKYQEKYLTPQSFMGNLCHMFDKLRYTKDQVYYQVYDPRNLTCSRWSRQKKKDKTMQVQPEALVMAEKRLLDDMNLPHEDLDDTWTGLGLADLSITDLPNRYFHPSEALYDEMELMQNNHYDPYGFIETQNLQNASASRTAS